MATKEELEIAIKVAEEIGATSHKEYLEKKLKELSIPEEEREFLKMFTVWIGNNGLHMKSDDKMAEMIFKYLKEHWFFSLEVAAEPAEPGWVYYGWDTIPENCLVSVMNSKLYVYKKHRDATNASVIEQGTEDWNNRDLSEVRTWGPFRLVEKDLSIGYVHSWYLKNVKGNNSV